MIERAALDPVHELPRLAPGRHIVEPAPRAHLIVGKTNDAASQQIAAAKIIDQPAVETELAKGGLDFGEVEHALKAATIGRGSLLICDHWSRLWASETLALRRRI